MLLACHNNNNNNNSDDEDNDDHDNNDDDDDDKTCLTTKQYIVDYLQERVSLHMMFIVCKLLCVAEFHDLLLRH